MEVITTAAQALVGTFPKRHACNHPLVALTPLVGVLPLVWGCQLRDGIQALVIGRVRGQPLTLRRGAAAFGPGHVGGIALLVFQDTDHVNHVARIEGVTRQIFGPQRIGLQLLVTTVRSHIARGDRLRHLARHLARTRYTLALQHRAQHAGSQHAQTGVLLAGGALCAVACRDVANLMAYHPGQISLAVHVGHDAARHIHIAPGQREGVDGGRVEHGEVPLQLLAVRLGRQALTQSVDIGLHRRVVVDAVLLQHLLVALGAFSDFAPFIHHRSLGLAANRVNHGGAAPGQ